MQKITKALDDIFVQSELCKESLRFKRDQDSGSHFARDDTKHYHVYKNNNKKWNLDVRELKNTAGVPHAFGQPVIESSPHHDTVNLAKRTAHHYSQLGDDYQIHEHGGKNRMTEATLRAYDEEKNS